MKTKTKTKTRRPPPLVTVLLSALALAGPSCDRRTASVSHVATPEETFALTSEWAAFKQGPDAKVDILFMVDNSLSMKPLQAKLAAGFTELMTVLEQLPGGTPDLHIGVVSSDMGAGDFDITEIPGCRRGGDGGALQFMPVGGCASTGLTEPFIAVRTDPATGQLVTNYGAQPLASVFSCIALIGDQGCGFEQQLSSVRHALDPALAPTGNAGFLRSDAFLAVILITNEDDCSIPADSRLFDPSSRLVSDPLGPLTSYRCNEFGHVCRIDGKLQHPPRTAAGPLEGCESAEDGKLDKVGDFVTFLKDLKHDPARVFLAAVTGPATPYTVSVSDALIPDSSPWPRIDHACVAADDSYGEPSVRIAQSVKAFGGHGLLSSICGDTMGPVLHEIAARFSRPLASSCVPTPSPTGPGCTVVDRWVEAGGRRAAQRVPSCDEAAGATPCWKLVDDAATCGVLAQRLEVDRGGAPIDATLVTAIDCSAAHP
jgi:hypothetical protein